MTTRDHLKAKLGRFAATLVVGFLFLFLMIVLALIHLCVDLGPLFMKCVLILAYLPGELQPYSKLGAMVFFWLQGFFVGGAIDLLRYFLKRNPTKQE